MPISRSGMKHFSITLCLLLAIRVCGQTTWISAAESGCKVYHPNPQPDEWVSWSGGCENGFAEGQGTLIAYSKGGETHRVIAPFTKGLPNGKGKYIKANGAEEEGYFVDGQLVKLEEAYWTNINKNYLELTDSSENYVGDGNSKSLFYYTISPTDSRGMLVLLCSTWETAEHNINSNKDLIQLAVDSQLTVIVPSINQRLSLNESVLSFLNTVFKLATEKYNLPKDNFVLGGFSMGGLFSLRYAEMAIEDPSKVFTMPKAVFSVDGPTDLENHYYSFERRFNNPRNTNKREAEYALNEFNKFM